MVFADGFLPFYSTFLGFLVYHWFPPFVALGTRTNVVSATLVASSFLIFSLFSHFEVSFQKVFSWPSPFGGPRDWLLISFSKVSWEAFQNLSFGYLIFCLFSLNRQIPPYQAKRSPTTFFNGSPCCFSRGTWLPFIGAGSQVIICFQSLFFLGCRQLMGYVFLHSMCLWACFSKMSIS